MRTTIFIVVCLLCSAQSRMTLSEMDKSDFGKTILDTIQLQLKNMDLKDGDLTGPPKFIYDMIKELEKGLTDQLNSDKKAYKTLCDDCDKEIGQYKGDIKKATQKQKLDQLELDTVQKSIRPLAKKKTVLAKAVILLNSNLKEIKTEYDGDKAELLKLKGEASDALNALLEGKRLLKAGLWDKRPAGAKGRAIKGAKKPKVVDGEKNILLEKNVSPASGSFSKKSNEVETQDKSHTEFLQASQTEGLESQLNADAEFLSLGGDGEYSQSLLETGSRTAIMDRLSKNANKFRGFTKLGAQIIEVAMEIKAKVEERTDWFAIKTKTVNGGDDVEKWGAYTADSNEGFGLLAAFNDLIDSLNAELTKLDKQLGARLTEFTKERDGTRRVLSLKMKQLGKTNVQLKLLKIQKTRLQNNIGKFDVDLGDWEQLLKDKTESCDSEKKAYDKKLCETQDEITLLQDVINLFETKFVELNAYMNSRAQMQDGKVVAKQ